MKKNLFAIAIIAVLVLGASGNLSGIDKNDTRMLSQPAASNTHVAFIYAGDLWVMNADGTNPRRLTVDEGIESQPCFSPDGRLIAFSAQYDGNTDVFVIPVEGGVPVRLTWHPGADYARTFTLTGRRWSSPRRGRHSPAAIHSSSRWELKGDTRNRCRYQMLTMSPCLPMERE